MNVPQSVVRIWVPLMFSALTCLFFWNIAPVFWLLGLPIFLIIIFMGTLAEVHDNGRQIIIKTSWSSTSVSKEDVLGTQNSFLEGIGVLRLKQFFFPWGRVYFVHKWSTGSAIKESSPIWTILSPIVLAISGFVVARVGNIRVFKISTSTQSFWTVISAGVLFFLFVVIRNKRAAFANSLLFAAAYLVGLIFR